MHKIVISDDEGKTLLLPFSRNEFTIGRMLGNTIRLTDRNISRRHARLFLSNKDSYYIENLGSKTGIKVDGEPVNKNSRVEVKPEARVTIGDYKLSVSKKDYKGLPLGIQMDPKVDKGVGKVTPFARLIMMEGPSCGLEIDLNDQLYIIGRSDRANVNIDDPSISRAHARIEGGGDRWMISDLDSINGIYINGEKKDDYLLKAGDLIDFGKIQFRFVGAGEPYDYESSRNRDTESSEDERNYASFIIRISVVLILAGMLVAWVLMRKETMDAKARHSISSSQMFRKNSSPISFDMLVADGKKKMHKQQWADAARLFAQAQRVNSDSMNAVDLKRNANLEIDAQTSLHAAIKARDDEDWSGAVRKLAEIPKESYYYSFNYVIELGEKLCDELIYKADFMITSEDPKAQELLSLIGVIPHVSKECLAKRDKLELRIENQKNVSDISEIADDRE